MKIKIKIKKILRIIVRFRHGIKIKRHYEMIMKKNHYPNVKKQGEKEWLEKWSVFGGKKRDLLLQYRLFYDYIGADINIVPEDICHDVIEPLLNPFRYCKYYADKNAFEKIIPGEYLPKTILRRMNGFYYDVNYHPISFNEEKLTELLNLSSGKIILKPSVGGSSGRNVMMFCVVRLLRTNKINN